MFGGDAHEIYLALLKDRCERDGLGTSDEVLARQFRLHLHRGIAYLAAPQTIRSIGDLIGLATEEKRRALTSAGKFRSGQHRNRRSVAKRTGRIELAGKREPDPSSRPPSAVCRRSHTDGAALSRPAAPR